MDGKSIFIAGLGLTFIILLIFFGIVITANEKLKEDKKKLDTKLSMVQNREQALRSIFKEKLSNIVDIEKKELSDKVKIIMFQIHYLLGMLND